MGLDGFIHNFEEAVEDVEPGLVQPKTVFRELDNWSSIAALMTLAMIYSEYGVQISGNELEACTTVEDLYNTTQAKVLEKV